MFKFHLVPLVLVELFVCRKYGKFWPKYDKYGPRKQLDVAGPPRPTCQRRPVPPSIVRPHLVPTWHFAMSLIYGSPSKTNGMCWSKSAQSMVTVKRPWIHGLIIIDLELNQPTYRPSFTTCCLHNCLGGATITLRCKDGASKGWPVPPTVTRCPRVATNLPATYKYPSPHSTL
jgi:hypothetical protein